MKPTVGVDQCFIVFIDPQNREESGSAAGLLERFRLFAQELLIPIYAINPSTFQTNKNESALTIAFKNAQSKGRDKLLIAGGSLESSVTVLAMNALAHGFDVYLLGDVLAQMDNGYSNLYWSRLTQAGIVPTTMVQMIVEWIASESDETTCSKLKFAAERFELARNH